MRRMLGLVCAFLLLGLAVDWAPGIPPHPIPSAGAQGFTIVGPGGVLNYTTASVTCVNTTTACTLYSYTIPSGYMATGSQPVAGTNFPTPPPLHLVLRGVLNTTSGGQIGTINAGANFGGSTATIALLNAHTPIPPGTLATVPLDIDIWISDIATQSNANLSANTVWMRGRISYIGNTGTETVTNSQVIGTTTLNSSQTLSVSWLWGSGNNINAVTIYNGMLLIGN